MSFLFRTAFGLALIASGGVTARASSMFYYASCSLSTGTSDFHQSGTPGQTMTAALPGSCSASNTSDYSTMHLYSSTAEVGPFVSVPGTAYTELSVQFYLTNLSLPANTIIPAMYIRVGYDFDIGAAPGGSGGARPGDVSYSAFDIRRTNDPGAQMRIASTSDVFGGNSCPSPLPTYPQCNGHYTGFVDIPLADPTRVNSSGPGGIGPNTFRLSVTLSSGNNAITDASHTVLLGGTVLPADTTFSYADLAGNPLGLTLAPTAAPEPGTVLLSIAGLVAILVTRRKR